MQKEERARLLSRLRDEAHPVLYKGPYSGSTPFHLGLDFLRDVQSEGGRLQKNAAVVIFTPTSTRDDDSEEILAESRLDMDSDAEKKQGHTKQLLCFGEELMQDGTKGDSAIFLQHIHVVYVEDLGQLTIALATFPPKGLHVDMVAQGPDTPNTRGDANKATLLIIIHNMNILSRMSRRAVPDTDGDSPPRSPTRSPSRSLSRALGHTSPEGGEEGDIKLLDLMNILGHALAALDSVSNGRLLMLDAGLEENSVKILQCYLLDDSGPEIAESDAQEEDEEENWM